MERFLVLTISGGVSGAVYSLLAVGLVLTYSTSGVLPESMWSTCDGTPAETGFEMHLTVAAVGLTGTSLRAVEASGTYRQYSSANPACAPAESTSTFTARRTS